MAALQLVMAHSKLRSEAEMENSDEVCFFVVLGMGTNGVTYLKDETTFCGFFLKTCKVLYNIYFYFERVVNIQKVRLKISNFAT